MKLKVGMYIRFNYHRVTVLIQIAKIKEKHYEEIEKYYYYLTDNGLIISEENIIKSSENIINLIEENDIVMYKYDNEVYISKVETSGTTKMLKVNLNYEVSINCVKILKVLTHEQFENDAYEVK